MFIRIRFHSIAKSDRKRNHSFVCFLVSIFHHYKFVRFLDGSQFDGNRWKFLSRLRLRKTITLRFSNQLSITFSKIDRSTMILHSLISHLVQVEHLNSVIEITMILNHLTYQVYFLYTSSVFSLRSIVFSHHRCDCIAR